MAKKENSERTHLTPTEILSIGKDIMAGKTFSEVADKLNVDRGTVRSAVYSLSKRGVKFPARKRETVSKYDAIAEQLKSK